jgi:predicted lipoprotein with Yx(FWY)xxD motif
MRISTALFAGAAVLLAGCNTLLGPPAAPVAPPGRVALTTATKAPIGTYVVDGDGRSLYVLEGTRGGSGINRCSGPCLAVWPPMSASSTQGLATGLNPNLVQRVSGYRGAQLTYGGWPLYYYQHDHVPSDTTGHGFRDQWGTWYLLSPSGEPIRPRY